jgi:hypothetical protein
MTLEQIIVYLLQCLVNLGVDLASTMFVFSFKDLSFAEVIPELVVQLLVLLFPEIAVSLSFFQMSLLLLKGILQLRVLFESFFMLLSKVISFIRHSIKVVGPWLRLSP